MDKPSGTGGGQRHTETEQLRADLTAARAELDKLTATLREQETSSMRVERARQAWAQTVDALAQPIFMHDEIGCIVRANRAYADRAGLPVKNLIGKVYWKLFPVRDSAFAVSDSEDGHTEFEFSASPDEVFLVRSVGAAAGLPPSWRLYIFQDITGLKGAEAAIRASAQYARSIVDSSLATIVAVDRDRRILEFNPAAERAFGYQREEVLGKSVNLLYDDPITAETVRRIALERDGLVGEIVNRRKNGELFTSLLSAAILRDAEGKMLGIVGTSMNISERKQAEDKLRAALAELELIFDNAAAGIAYVRDRVIERVNRRFAEMLGYDKDELVGKSTEILYPAREDYENLGREAYPELAKGGIYQADVQFKRKDGSLFRVHLIGRAVSREKEGTESIWVFEDITERKAAEERLQRREAYYRALVENSSDVIIVVNAEGRIKYESPGIERMLGYGAAERIGHSSFELVHPDDVAGVEEAYQRILGGEARHARVEFRMRRRDGSWRIVEAMGSGVFESGGEKIGIVNLRDVSERRHSEQRLLESMEGAVIAVAIALESRDPYKAGHGNRVAVLAAKIGRELGLPEERVRGIRLAAVVHDIGKIHIPVEILMKPGQFNEIELEIMRTHCQAGYEILKHLDFPWPIAQIVMQHHELLDGSGYPLKLQGDDILLETRIVTVANVVEAMTGHRAHLAAAGIDAALAEIMRFRGVKFDPEAVDACVRLFREKGFMFADR